MMSCFILAWFLSVIGMIGWDESEPVTGWRKVLQSLVGVLGRTSMFFIGFHSVTYHGRQCSTEEAPILVVAPHTSFFDALVVFCCGFPYFINRTENQSLPLLGRCITFRQAVFVSRDRPDSRQRTVEEITRRVRWVLTQTQCSPLSLVEECRGLALIGRELQSDACASNLMP